MSVIIIQLHHGFGGMVFRELINFKGPSVDSEKNMVRFGLKLKEITTSYAKIAVVWAGAIPYFSDRYCIDLLGPNDAFIARQKARVKDFRDFWPGENKYNYDYSIGVLKPDIVAQLWFESREAFVYLDKYYQAFKIDSHIIYCRKDSPNVIWAKLKNTDLN